MQILPSPPLSKLIKHYLFIESNTRDIKKFRLFPDGNTGIVFSFKNLLISEFSAFNNINYLPNSFIYGQIQGFRDMFCVNETSLLIVVFQPFGLNQLLNIPADQLMNEIISLPDLFGDVVTETIDKLFLTDDKKDKIKIIELFLMKISNDNIFRVQPLIIASLDFIIKNQGLNRMEQLVEFTGYTSKSIERKFLETIGLSPKRYSNIIKLNAYIKSLSGHNIKLKNIAYETGYYDYSHALQNFKKITGITPMQYVNKFNVLALNLLEFENK